MEISMKTLPLQVRLLPIFSELADSTFERLSSSCQWLNLVSGENLCNKGDPSSHLFILVRGELQVYQVSRDGHELGLNLLKGPAVFGELGVIDGAPRSADITALSACSVAMIPRRVLMETFTGSPEAASAMFRHLTRMVRKASRLQSMLSMPSANQRIAAMLVQLAELKVGAHANVIDLPKQKVLAQMVNTTRETVSRTLNLLIDQGLIQKINGSWVIQDANGLKQAAGLD